MRENLPIKQEKGRSEWLTALALVALVFVINLLVAERTPTVFSDEPPYVDPAANLYFGNGFVSTMWAQDRHETWCGNVPLYQGVLYLGFRVLGFGLGEARWINAALLSAGALLIWQALRQSQFLHASSSRLWCMSLVLSGAVSTLTFRTLRPDVMMFFCVAAVFFCCTIQSYPIRLPLVILSAALLPFAGIAMIPYAFILASLMVLFLRRPAVLTCSAAIFGTCLGIGGLFLFYNRVASVHEFLSIILPFTALNGSSVPFRTKLIQKIFGASPEDPDNLLSSFFGDPRELINPKMLCDYGALLLFILLIAVFFLRRRTLDAGAKRGTFLVLTIVLLVPPSLHYLAHYRAMYRWMTYVPLCVGVPFLLERSVASLGDWYRRPAYGICLGAIVMGVPLRTLDAARTWSSRSIDPIEQAAAEIVHGDDIVLCSNKLYFSIRRRARLVYASGLPSRGVLEKTVDAPKEQFSLLCVQPGDESEIFSFAGGQWQPVHLRDKLASALAKTRYNAIFYRRQFTPRD